MPLAQRILSTTTLGLLLCTLAVFGVQPVQAAVQINAASWDGNTLTADGSADKPKRGGGPVEIFDAADDSSLGPANLKNSGSWDYSGTTCADNIYASQNGITTGSFPVSGPGCGGGGNTPPTANDDSYQTTVNMTLNVAAPGVLGNDTDDGLLDPLVVSSVVSDVTNGSLNLNADGSFDYTPGNGFIGTDSFTYEAYDGEFTSTANVSILVDNTPPVNTPPTANPDNYNATTGVELSVAAPGVLGNDTDDGQLAPLVVSNLITDVLHGTLSLNVDGSFTYTGNSAGPDSFTYEASDGEFVSEASVTITVSDALPPIDPELNPQTDFKIMMNYELGMHCTGFEFAYCCVLPAYNSILAQVVKPNTQPVGPGTGSTNADYARLMAGDPNEGLDALGRETVVRDLELDNSGNFKKYVLTYWHEAQPRNNTDVNGNLIGKSQSSLLISAAEGNSLMSWNTTFDGATVDSVTGELVTGLYNGSDGVMQGDGDLSGGGDNYQNAVWNHLYFYNGLEGEFACSAPGGSVGNRCSVDADCDTGAGPGNGVCDITSEGSKKIRLGVNGQVVFPTDCGPALHPLGPKTAGGESIEGDANSSLLVDNDCGGFSNGNVLTFSGDKGTVVYTQIKVLENLPIMLTSPDIWEALGLPLTPFEDSIDFFGDPGLLNEDSVRPFVAMKAQMHEYDPADTVADDGDAVGVGAAVLDGSGNPVIGFGTAPIDIPNCERCHSNPPTGSTIDNAANEGGGTLTVINSPNIDGSQQWLDTQAEYAFWNAYYSIDKGAGDSDWYSRLKSAAISMLSGHDVQHGTSFTANFPGCIDSTNPSSDCGALPQNTRLGHESIICQRCHADNVIAAVKSATSGGALIMPITEAIHNNHRGVNMSIPDANGDPVGGPITFADSNGRDGGCQGCHPAHRSDGDMNGYPITLAGGNLYANSDNRGANGGCFVGRDVHSNPGKDTDGAETPAYMNAVGQHLVDNVASTGNGIWCTNCHNQLGQEIWKAENMVSLVHGVPGKQADGVTDAVNIRALPTLAEIAQAVGTTTEQAMSWLDPTEGLNPGDDDSYAIWAPDPGLCQYLVNPSPAHDGNVATVEVAIIAAGHECSTGEVFGPVDCSVDGGPIFNICGSYDGDGDFSVNAMDFCTTPDCVAAAQGTLTNSAAVPVPMSAATDGRDHWLSPGEPHCADCHAAPFVEQSGNINAYPPFNYPRKASLMRYSKGHQNISCQGCHESIHGLYPVTPNIDTTSYAQAAALNHDGTHGPIKCGACHEVNGAGVPTIIEDGLLYNGQPIVDDYDAAVAWMHTFTDEADGLGDYCLNCHTDNSGDISSTNRTWTEHASKGRSSREMMDKAEVATIGHVAGDPAFEDPQGTVCTSCHGDRSRSLERKGCSVKWRNHLIEGRASEVAWEHMSTTFAGSTCGW